ncbi:FAD/NAD(P)-binding domain-containing protein [Coniophora puteana RWD-64-598 SS2]|uniref:FAD/NAD(P)-binding domain-containing protein n=1 Tax=Coniophora puteana (strain RWD-64-598) TaxID=741705 RepID=A0A5M3MLU7_CONPW|nr:FAD/NAD(P)-binding domain-containing protein [Coniophora puteana RWD-64-598 SS2]EIW80026.1 FAD/NAD(P)-binding domain-containing protein [Coniophora puteana RWD-64-598 SS2]
MTSVQEPRLRIAICGGGISGLALAVALSQVPDVNVQLYESAGRFREIGAGVMIWFRTWRILELLGVAEDFAKVANAPPTEERGIGFDYRRSDMAGEGFRFGLFELPYGCIRFHRAHFLGAFIANLPSNIAHFGKRLASYDDSASGPVSLHFGDGTSAECDLLVGCDGIKSSIRTAMLHAIARETGNAEVKSLGVPYWSGIIAYRGLIPTDKLVKDGKEHPAIATPIMYCGKSKHVVGYGISRGTVVNVITMNSHLDKEGTPYSEEWVTECSTEELLDCYAGWEDEVTDLLRHIEQPTKWGLHSIKPLPTYVHGSVALVGDSAHAMLPHQGAGSGQAIEDAYVLSRILSDPIVTKSSLSHALAAYDAVRRPKANAILVGSRKSGQMYEFDDEALGERYEDLGPAIVHMWDWLWEEDPEADAREALDKMHAAIRDGLS